MKDFCKIMKNVLNLDFIGRPLAEFHLYEEYAGELKQFRTIAVAVDRSPIKNETLRILNCVKQFSQHKILLIELRLGLLE